MKKIALICGIVIIGLVAISLMKNNIIKSTITVVGSQVTGAPVHIDSLSLGVFQQAIDIKGFRMYNPPGFPNEILIDMPQIYASCDIGALLGKKVHLKKIIINIKEMGIVKNKEGKLNIDSLKVMQKEEKPKAEAKKPAAGKIPPFQIDELHLNVGKIVYRDYTVGPQPSVQVYDVDIKDKVYKNITSAKQLTTLIISEPLKKTAISSAKVYAASAVLGVGFLPAGVAITLLGKDSGQQSFDLPFKRVYDTSLAILNKSGSVTAENDKTGIIKAVVNKNDVTVKVKQMTDKTTELTVAAKRLLLPKPEIAKGILLEISEKLK